MILLYTPDRKAFIGFIPNDQAAFVDRLRKLIQHQKASSAMLRQGQVRILIMFKSFTFVINKYTDFGLFSSIYTLTVNN